MNIEKITKLNPSPFGSTLPEDVDMLVAFLDQVNEFADSLPDDRSAVLAIAVAAYQIGWTASTELHPNSPWNASEKSVETRQRTAAEKKQLVQDMFAAAIRDGLSPTVTEIGKKAGVSRATAYRAFKKNGKTPR
jgi:DNA invertase Pin-like site-specific DNA recombinase